MEIRQSLAGVKLVQVIHVTGEKSLEEVTVKIDSEIREVFND